MENKKQHRLVLMGSIYSLVLLNNLRFDKCSEGSESATANAINLGGVECNRGRINRL